MYTEWTKQDDGLTEMFASGLPQVWTTVHGELWAIVNLGHEGINVFLDKARTEFFCAPEIAAAEDAMGRPFGPRDVDHLWLAPGNDGAFYWADGDDPSHHAVTAITARTIEAACAGSKS
jgi:hypothetical protein